MYVGEGSLRFFHCTGIWSRKLSATMFRAAELEKIETLLKLLISGILKTIKKGEGKVLIMRIGKISY